MVSAPAGVILKTVPLPPVPPVPQPPPPRPHDLRQLDPEGRRDAGARAGEERPPGDAEGDRGDGVKKMTNDKIRMTNVK